MGELKALILAENTSDKKSSVEYEFLGTDLDKVFWEEMLKFGYKRDDFYCYSIFGNLGHKKDKLSEKELNDFRFEFRKTLLMIDPIITLSVGRVPTEELLQKNTKGEFFDIINKVLFSKEYNIWFIPTIHPSMVVRDPMKKSFLEKGVEVFCETYKELIECEPHRFNQQDV